MKQIPVSSEIKSIIFEQCPIFLKKTFIAFSLEVS